MTQTPNPASPLLARVGQIAVNARDLERAVAFYRDVLGLRFLFQAPPQMAFFECGGVRLLLGVAEKPADDHLSSVLYFQVADIGAAHDQLAARGVVFVGKPHSVARLADHDLWLAFFRDSEDNTMALMSEVRR
jgi:methylmalonyl-CoA/ethylmalonyl-CoA epimerase